MMGTQLAERTYLLERVWNRLHRMASDMPKARMSSELIYRAERDAYRRSLPGSSVDDDLLAELQRTGIVMTTAEELGLSEVVAAAQPLAQELQDLPVPPDLPATHLSSDRMRTSPDVFRWGASDRVLDLVERYFELPVAYHGVYLRRDMAVKKAAASNQWHLDMEDRRVIKLVVYLTDVEDGDGSFQYLPLEHSKELRRALGPNYRVGPDEQMSKFVSDTEWRSANGPAGTILISDTAMLYHKGRRPEHTDRVTLFYDYTTRQPLHPFYCKSAMPRPVLEELTEGMGQRALDAVFWRPRLKEFDPVKHEG